MKKPLIGVVPLYDSEKESFWMLPGYMEGIEAAGGIPVMLPMTADDGILDTLVGALDSFLLTGGQDVDPALYGAAKSPACGETCPARDAMEPKLLKLALDADKPVFGICRGIQLLNACLGGTLYQDLPAEHESAVDHHMNPPYDRAVHEVTILADTPLAALLGKMRLGVNSYHHQAVKTLAPVLRPMALADDGLVEAAYLPGKRFCMAVQWHPEFSYKTDAGSRALLAAFVRAAAK